MGCCESKDTLYAYYNPSSALIKYNNPTGGHHCKNEFSFVTQEDSSKFAPNDECYIVHSGWLQEWLDFAMEKKIDPPKGISNRLLLDERGVGLKSNMKAKYDFRPINRLVWEFLFRLYGGGPVIVFRVPEGLPVDAYSKGSWIKKVNIKSNCVIIFPGPNPKPNDSSMTGNPILSSDRDRIASLNVEMTANHLLHDLGKQKMQQAKELDKEINQENADAIGALMAKDLGKKKMAEAKQKEAEANQASAESAAHLFAGNIADQKAREAKEAKTAASVAQTDQTAAIFTNMGAKLRFKEALKVGNMSVAEDAAAVMLQGAWRSRKARRRMQEMKRKREQFIKESAARKLQSRYRSRLARQRVEQLKAERQRLREEGAAIMLQSNWRCRKSREKVQRLKEQKQRLLEEGAALMLQSAWRIKQARAKVAVLRNEKNEQRKAAEMSAALLLTKLLRGAAARSQYRRLLMQQKQIITIHLKSAMGINIADVNSSDPYVYIATQTGLPAVATDDSSLGAAARSPQSKQSVMKRRRSSIKDLSLKDTKTISLYRSKTIPNSLNPTWEEQCLVTEVGFDDAIVFTLMDKDTFNKDDFLGQTIICASKYLELYSGKAVKLNLLPIESYRCPVFDAKGSLLTSSSTDTKGQGNFFLSLKLADPTHSMSGWVQKLAGSVLGGFGSQTFKSRYMVLTKEAVKYYDDSHSLDHPRAVIRCDKVETLAYNPDKTGIMVLQIKGDGEDWFLKWVSNETTDKIAMWIRRIQVNCPQARLNNLDGNLMERLETSLGSRGAVQRMKSSTIAPQPSSTVKRRASNLFKG